MEFKINKMDDIVDVILKAEQYQYFDLKQRTIQKLKNILMQSKNQEEARLLLNIDNDFTKEEEDFYCHPTYWNTPELHSLNQHENSNCMTDEMSISDVMVNPMILMECGKHLYYFLKKRKLQKIIDETLITHCENCRCTFTMIYRKHHCRSCGKVFCSSCCYKTISVPKEFLSYTHTSIFSYFSKEERVCENCYNEISEFHSVSLLIHFFKILGLEIHLLQRCGTLSKPWRKAILFYFGFMREIIYKLLHFDLDDAEIRFLYNNRNILYHHSTWNLQLLKTQVNADTITPCKSSCWDCMCARNCHQEMDIFDAFVVIVLDSKYPTLVNKKAIQKFKETDIDKWIYFIPFLFSKYPMENKFESNEILFDLLTEISKTNPKVYSILYWGLSVCCFANNDCRSSKSRRVYEHQKEKLLLESPVFSKTFIGILHFLSHCEDYYKHRDQSLLCKNLSTVSRTFFCPIHPNRKIKKIIIDEIKIKSSITTPLFIPYECEDGTKSAILFKKEDIRKDATAMAMAKLYQKILEENNIQVPFISYEVIPTSPTSGFIEIVKQSKTLHEIFQEGTINNYLQIHNPEKKFGEILENYMKSLAFWTIFTYLLGVGDRHLENIMLTSDGVLFHIDYGFILGYETKPYVPLIRIDNSILEGIGGNVQYEKFKSICIDMFLCLRRYSSLIFCCFMTFASCDPPIQNTKFTLEFLENHIVDRFLLGQSETDVSFTLSKLIDNSRDAVTLKVSDYIHTYASKIPTSKGIFNWFSKK
jgi:hypothetical protein